MYCGIECFINFKSRNCLDGHAEHMIQVLMSKRNLAICGEKVFVRGNVKQHHDCHVVSGRSLCEAQSYVHVKNDV